MRPDPSRQQYLDFFARSYDAVNYNGRTLGSRVLRHGHALIERAYGPDERFDTVLEVGAGHGEHIDFVRHKWSRYVMTDLRADELIARFAKEAREGVECRTEDASSLSLPENFADRLIASHVLEHMPAPWDVLREWSRVVRPGGVISLVQPCDPGLAWRLGRRLGPRRQNHAAGNVDYDYWMAYEHVNAIQNLHTFISHYFPKREEMWFPFGVKSFDANLLFVTHLTNNK